MAEMIDNDFLYTQALRRRLIDDMAGGEALPQDPKEREFLRKLLVDVDRQQVDRKKLDIDQANANNTRDIADGMLALAKRQQNRHLFERHPDAPPLEALETFDASRLGEFDFVEGETHIGVTQETYEEFSKRMGLEQQGPTDPSDPE